MYQALVPIAKCLASSSNPSIVFCRLIRQEGVISSATSTERWKQEPEVKPLRGKKEHELQSMQFLKTQKIKIDSQRMAVLRDMPLISLHTFPVLRTLTGLKSSQTQAWLKPREFSTISFTHAKSFQLWILQMAQEDFWVTQAAKAQQHLELWIYILEPAQARGQWWEDSTSHRKGLILECMVQSTLQTEALSLSKE